jgi:predicted phage terminase large subunit-like protein
MHGTATNRRERVRIIDDADANPRKKKPAALRMVPGAAGKQHYTADKKTREHVDNAMRLLYAKAREDFWTYRQLINPNFIKGWWQDYCSMKLQEFYLRFKAKERPRMIFGAPPQHGKSKMVTDFTSWCAGKNPDIRALFTSYSDELGTRTNAELQRIYLSEAFKQIFYKTRVNEGQTTLPYKLNSELIEYVGHRGSFRNTTVNGAINGFGLDLGEIDDPIKGRAEAMSKLVRDKVWGWLTDDFFGRFSDEAAMLLTMTRWHLDDPAGRFIAKFPTTEVVAFKAVATQDEEYRKAGDALFPEHKTIEFLLERRHIMTIAGWEAVYQQNPIIQGGGMFPIESFQLKPMPARSDIVATVRYWDKAGTEDGGAFTCGVRIHKLKDKTFFVSDVRAGQWGALRREDRISQTLKQDNAEFSTVTYVEQEPGSGGKESAENTIRSNAGYRIKADKVTGAKEVRAEPYSAQVQGKNVALLLGAEWVQGFMDEHEVFPNGPRKDKVDAASGAFNKLVAGGNYDSSYGWV